MLVTSDSTAIIRHGEEEAEVITLAQVPTGVPRFECADSLLTFLYRLEATTDTISGTIKPYAPYALYINPLPADKAAETLAARLRNDIPVPPELARYSWPVVRENAQWLMAASETALAGGDERWTKRVLSAVRQVLGLDTRMALNRESGLFGGTPRYLLSPASRFPAWMEPVDLFQNLTLSENAAYHAALSNIEHLAASRDANYNIPYHASDLRKAINSNLWNPATGTYGATLYGNPACPVRLSSADNAAQSIAIIGGAATEAMAASIASKTPIGPSGANHLEPGWDGDSVPASEFPPMLLKALWMTAMGTTPNETAYSAAVAALIAGRAKALFDSHSGSSQNTELSTIRPMAALILRGFLGARFTHEGLYFNPSVPAELPGDKHVAGLRYRKALLDISITGTGRALATFTIDGKPAAPFIPAALEGKHDIAITLAGTAAEPGSVTYAEKQVSLPPPPQAAWPGPLTARLYSGDQSATTPDGGYAVYLNGILDMITISEEYSAASPRHLVVAQFAAISAEQRQGFTSAPHTILPRGWETIIPAADHANPGTRLISDREAAAKVVESNRWKNRVVSISFDAPAAGRYLADVRYSSGLGIVNPHRRTALRRLKVNGEEAGIFVFPQFSPAWWNSGTGIGWQFPTTYSSQLCVELRKGANELELVYFQPSPVYIDPFANTLLFDAVRIRRLE